MSDTPKPQNYEYSKKIKYKDMEFEIVFKIDSNSDLEILCLCENGLTFSTKKLNIKESSLDFELFSDFIKFDENWSLEGVIDKENFSIKIFKIIRLNLKEINANENSQKIIHYLCKKIMDLSKQLSEKKENELKVIPLTLANGWSNYGSIYAPGKIIKKGNEITLSGLIKGTKFSTVCILPEDCRPKNVLIFSLNHHETIMRFDVYPNGNVTYIVEVIHKIGFL